MKLPDNLPPSLPLLPLRNRVVFPQMAIPLYVGRERSVLAVETAFHGDELLVLATQRDPDMDDPRPGDLYSVGVLASVIQLFRMRDGTLKTLVNGLQTVRITETIQEHPFTKVGIQPLIEAEPVSEERQIKALEQMKAMHLLFEEYVQLSRRLPLELVVAVQQIREPRKLSDAIMGQLSGKVSAARAQGILEQIAPVERLEKTLELLEEEVSLLRDENQLRRKIRTVENILPNPAPPPAPHVMEGEDADPLAREMQDLQERIYAKQ